MHFFRLVFVSTFVVGFWACSGAPEGTDLPPAGQGGDPGQGGEPGTAGETPSPNSVLLAQSQGEAPLDACPNGGVLVAFGVDTNANGELDDDEIQRREAICHGADGAPGQSCAIADNEDGSYTVTCPDSEPVTISNGADGRPGEQGPQGEPGEVGTGSGDRYTGTPRGEPGEDGAEGEQGPQGRQGWMVRPRSRWATWSRW